AHVAHQHDTDDKIDDHCGERRPKDRSCPTDTDKNVRSDLNRRSDENVRERYNDKTRRRTLVTAQPGTHELRREPRRHDDERPRREYREPRASDEQPRQMLPIT